MKITVEKKREKLRKRKRKKRLKQEEIYLYFTVVNELGEKTDGVCHSKTMLWADGPDEASGEFSVYTRYVIFFRLNAL